MSNNAFTQALLDASKEIGLEVNSEKTKYMFMSRHQTAGQSNYIRVSNRSFERVTEFKYLGATLTDQNCIHEEIRSRLNSGNACYRAVQNLWSSRLLSRNVKTKIYKTIVLPVVFYGCETLSLTLREEHRLRVFQNRVLRRIFGPKRDKVPGGWRKLHNEALHTNIRVLGKPDLRPTLQSSVATKTGANGDARLLVSKCIALCFGSNPKRNM
jgi:hypothetical protein